MRSEATKSVRKTIIENLDLLYNPRDTIDESNFYTHKHYMLLADIIFRPILLALLVILVPLGGLKNKTVENDDGGTSPVISKWAYLAFQLVYCAVAYNCVVLPFYLPIKYVLAYTYVWIWLPLIIGIVLFACYQVIIGPTEVVDMVDTITFARVTVDISFLPVIGIACMFIIIWISYFIGCMYYDNFTIVNNNDRNSNDQSIHVPNMVVNPMGTRSSIIELSRKSGPSHTDDHIIADGESTLNSKLVTCNTMHTGTRRTSVFLLAEGSCLLLFYKVLATSIMFCGMYNWCVLFTSFFEQLQQSKYVAFLVFGFYIIHSLGSLLLRMVANQVDRDLAAGCASMNIIMSLVADTFLITFQRNLFTLVTSWTSFVEINAASLLFEVLIYQVQTWHVYEVWHDHVLVRGKAFVEGDRSVSADSVGGFCYIYSATHFWYPGRLFVNKNALHLAYKFVLRITSSISYLLFSTLLRYGYNSPYYAEASYSERTYQNLMYFILLSLLFDFIVISVTDYFLRKRTGLSLYCRFMQFFAAGEGSEYVHFLIWVTTHITSDIFVAKILYSLVVFRSS